MKTVYNEDLKQLMRQNKISVPDISNVIMIADSTIYRWLRHPLSDENRAKIVGAIGELIGAEK